MDRQIAEEAQQAQQAEGDDPLSMKNPDPLLEAQRSPSPPSRDGDRYQPNRSPPRPRPGTAPVATRSPPKPTAPTAAAPPTKDELSVRQSVMDGQWSMRFGAKQRFKQLDNGAKGWLEGDDVLALSEWVWLETHKKEGGLCSSRERLLGAQRILEACDREGQGVVYEQLFIRCVILPHAEAYLSRP